MRRSLVLFTCIGLWTAASTAEQFLPRQVSNSRWHEPPFTPNFSAGVVPVSRSGDTLSIDLPLFGDHGGHAGWIEFDTGLQLYRNGQKIGDTGSFSASFPVSEDAATYRLVANGSQGIFDFSTRIDAAWTFNSARAAEAVSLPLLTVNFEPSLNETNQAPRGAFEFPITVHQVGKREAVTATSLALEASFNDGKTWQSVPVRRRGATWIARLNHPAQGSYVSLRVKARESSNSIEQTVLRAYGLK